MFLTFTQNNSGGRYDVDHDAGISIEVIVEGLSRGDIYDRAETIGLYFDGCDTGRDCSCCGDRWYFDRTTPLDDVPSIGGVDVSAGVYVSPHSWQRDSGRPYAYIHYRDGRVVPVRLQTPVVP